MITLKGGIGMEHSRKSFFLITILFAGFLLSLSAIPSHGQWVSIFGGANYDLAESIQQADDGGYIVAGHTISFGAGGSDAWILKFDAGGNIVWQRTYGGSLDEYARAIQQTQDGGYIVAGDTYAYEPGIYNFWVLKIDGSGNIDWKKTYTGDRFAYARAIQQTLDGGYIVAGTVNLGGSDAWILKLDGNGLVVWERTYGDNFTNDYHAYSIQQTLDGGYIVAGYIGYIGTGAWVFKIDENGNVLWQTGLGPLGSYARAIQQTQDGGYIVAGFTDTYYYPYEGYAWACKLDGSGNGVWQKVYGGDGRYQINSVKQTQNGEYILAGHRIPLGVNSHADVSVLKLDGSGNIVWQKTFGGIYDDYGNSVQQTQDGGYIISGGTTFVGTNNAEMLLLKLDENGSAGSCSLEGDSNALATDLGAGAGLTNIASNAPEFQVNAQRIAATNLDALPLTPAVIVDEWNALATTTNVSLIRTCPYVALSLTEYLPLIAGTIWTYLADGGETLERQVKKKALVNGVGTSIVDYVDERTKEYYTNDSNGILLHRQYQPHVYVDNIGWVNIDVTFEPPIKFASSVAGNGDYFRSEGIARTKVSSVGRAELSYGADTIIEAMENITVPAGNFDSLRIRTAITLYSPYGNSTISRTSNLAEGIGIVKDVLDDTQGVTSTAELVSTNAGIYDLAITGITPPKKVTLSSGTPSKKSILKLKIQNKGPFPEIIEDSSTLTNLITVTAESLGTCPAPSPILHAGKPQKPFPIILKPGKTLTVYYDVNFDCANDAAQGTPDYRFSAVVNRVALGGKADSNPVNDICPRDSISTDKGCGTKKPDGTLGGDILTDVIVK